MARIISDALTALRLAQLDWATPNFCFRAFVKADAFPLHQAAQNEHFNRFLLWSKPAVLSDTMAQVQKLLREEAINQSVTFSVIAKQSGTWAGFLRWIPYDKGLAISFWLHPDFWGNGASKELVDCVFDIVFKATDLDDLYALMQPENRPPIRLAKNKGMANVGSTQIIHQDGAPRDFHVYHAERSMWKNPVELAAF